MSRLSEISVSFFNSHGCDTPVSNIRPYINDYLAELIRIEFERLREFVWVEITSPPPFPAALVSGPST